MDDAPGKSADVGAAVSAYLRLVVHASERNVYELAPHRARDGFSERRFADARRADEADDLRAHILASAFLDGEKFKDALFYVFKAIVVFVKDLARVRDVEVVFRRDVPRKLRQRLDVVPRDGGLGRKRRQLAEAADFLVDLLQNILGHPAFGRGFSQLVGLRGRALFAELVVYHFELLAQVIVVLVAVDF